MVPPPSLRRLRPRQRSVLIFPCDALQHEPLRLDQLRLAVELVEVDDPLRRLLLLPFRVGLCPRASSKKGLPRRVVARVLAPGAKWPFGPN